MALKGNNLEQNFEARKMDDGTKSLHLFTLCSARNLLTLTAFFKKNCLLHVPLKNICNYFPLQET